MRESKRGGSAASREGPPRARARVIFERSASRFLEVFTLPRRRSDGDVCW